MDTCGLQIVDLVPQKQPHGHDARAKSGSNLRSVTTPARIVKVSRSRGDARAKSWGEKEKEKSPSHDIVKRIQGHEATLKS